MSHGTTTGAVEEVEAGPLNELYELVARGGNQQWKMMAHAGKLWKILDVVMKEEREERRKWYHDTLFEYIAILEVGEVAVPGVNPVMSPTLSLLEYNNAVSLVRQQHRLFIRLFLIGCTSYSLDIISEFTSQDREDFFMSAVAEAKKNNIHSKVWEMVSAHTAKPVFN